MNIPFAVYTAFRGYAWSSVPDGMSAERLDDLYRKACALRPDFLGGDDYLEGVLCDMGTVVAFRLQSVPKWDSVGRTAEYGAFAFPSFGTIRAVDFGSLLSHEAFLVPNREPPPSIEYGGPTAVLHDDNYLCELYERGTMDKCDFRAIGDILYTYQECCNFWRFTRCCVGGEVTVTVGAEPWECIPESWLEKGLVSLSWVDREALEGMSKEGK